MSRNKNILLAVGLLAIIAILISSFNNLSESQRAVVSTEVPVADEMSAEESLATVAPVQQALKTIETSLSVGGRSFSTEIREGSTAYDLMDELRRNGNISFTGDYYEGLGYFITSIDGVKNDGRAGKYWTYYVNGTEASVGASAHVLKDGDVILWSYGTELKKDI